MRIRKLMLFCGRRLESFVVLWMRTGKFCCFVDESYKVFVVSWMRTGKFMLFCGLGLESLSFFY